MAFNIENVSKQIAALAPKTQAKLFESLAKLAGQSSVQELAENYQRLLGQADTAAMSNAAVVEAQKPSKPKPCPSTAELNLQHNRIGESMAVYGSDREKASEVGKSYHELYAIFDGEALRPESKVALDLNTRYKVLIEKPISRFPEIKNRALRRIAARAIHMGIRDFAEQHDHYLCGVPKN